jgi:tyrosine-protein phosphatase YwqE
VATHSNQKVIKGYTCIKIFTGQKIQKVCDCFVSVEDRKIFCFRALKLALIKFKCEKPKIYLIKIEYDSLLLDFSVLHTWELKSLSTKIISN